VASCNAMKQSQKIQIDSNEYVLLQKVAQLLRKEPGKKYPLRFFVLLTGLNRTKLDVLFQAVYGMPIKQYQLQYRLHLAKIKLSSTYLPVKAIALECGFGNGKYFYQYFKKKTGLTPGTYRQLYRRPKKG